MENNFEKNKIVPIERGEEIKTEKEKEKIDGIAKELDVMIDEITDAMDKVGIQLEEAWGKPDDEENKKVINSLLGELKILEDINADLFEMIGEIRSKQFGAREKLDSIKRKIEERKF